MQYLQPPSLPTFSPLRVETSTASSTSSQVTPVASVDANDSPQECTKPDPGVDEADWKQLQLDLQAQNEVKRQFELLKERETAAAAEYARKEALRIQALGKRVENSQPDAGEDAAAADEARLERMRAEAERVERIKAAAEFQMRAEEQRREEKAQQKLRQMGVCVAGFRWIKQSSGYQCAGGTHFISNDRLGV